jgi:hypothetical protein
MVGVEVVGGIYSTNHQFNRWGRLLSMGAPNSPVRYRTVRCVSHVTQPLGFWRFQLLELCLLVAPDMYCSLSGAPLTAALLCPALFAHCSSGIQLLQATVARSSRCSVGAPESSVNYSRATPEKPEGEEFRVVRPWCTRHCPVH